ncbi:MAG: hypothetical protein ACXVAY_00590 [Mucilaginibacter sp.]
MTQKPISALQKLGFGALCLFSVILFAAHPKITKAQPFYNATNSVYQYAVDVGSKKAYLWIPPASRQVRGVIISFDNLLERNWMEDPIIRQCAQKNNLAMVLVGLSKDGITPDLVNNQPQILLTMLTNMAKVSGYAELQYAPLLPIDHSVHGVFTWNVAKLFPQRTIAAIPVKAEPFPTGINVSGIPICYIIGENDEWQPKKGNKIWQRDLIWRQIRHSAVALRKQNPDNMISVVTDPGGGHLDWSGKLSTFLALYIDKACKYRLPDHMPGHTIPKLKKINPVSGWVTDTAGLDQDHFKPASYQNYTGNPKRAYWFFDKQTARAAAVFAGDRIARKPQMLTFVQNGRALPLAKQGFVDLQFAPQSDGITFNIEGDFFKTVPTGLSGAGSKIGHANGVIRFRLISGPAIQTGPSQFKIQLSRSSTQTGDVWIQAEHSGNSEYKHAVQPGRIKIPATLTMGKPQQITFPGIPNQKVGNGSAKLSATSGSGLPVSYYVAYGPAIIQNNILVLTKIPRKSKYPIKVLVVAYQLGRRTEPSCQSAIPVAQHFNVGK